MPFSCRFHAVWHARDPGAGAEEGIRNDRAAPSFPHSARRLPSTVAARTCIARTQARIPPRPAGSDRAANSLSLKNIVWRSPPR
jgi:hypothetical protein